MNYSINWLDQTATVNYFGGISNFDIKHAHFSLNGDERFYDCKALVLNISDCTMDKVSVDDLIEVIGTDLGASKVIQSLKVAMVASKEQNRDKASHYIATCQSLGYPWRFRLFHLLEDAQRWVDS